MRVTVVKIKDEVLSRVWGVSRYIKVTVDLEKRRYYYGDAYEFIRDMHDYEGYLIGTSYEVNENTEKDVRRSYFDGVGFTENNGELTAFIMDANSEEELNGDYIKRYGSKLFFEKIGGKTRKLFDIDNPTIGDSYILQDCEHEITYEVYKNFIDEHPEYIDCIDGAELELNKLGYGIDERKVPAEFIDSLNYINIEKTQFPLAQAIKILGLNIKEDRLKCTYKDAGLVSVRLSQNVKRGGEKYE